MAKKLIWLFWVNGLVYFRPHGENAVAPLLPVV